MGYGDDASKKGGLPVNRLYSMARRWLFAALLAALPLATAAAPAIDWNAMVAQAVTLREHGDLQKAIDLLAAASRAADADAALRARAAGELGATLLQARRLDQAEAPLRQAYDAASGAERARYALQLGNLAQLRKRKDDARQFYREAASLAPGDNDLQLAVALNQARLTPAAERLAALSALSQRIAAAPADARLARHHLNLGSQARQLGKPGLALAYGHAEEARRLALQSGNKRLLAEALDALAQIYEDNGRGGDALALNGQALDLARTLESAVVADLMIDLEWRQGRLLRAAGEEAPALAAYQRAVAQVEAVRQDIPIEYDDGRSSYRETLEPIYLGYADLLLRQIDKQPADIQAAQLRQALETIELLRQSELQDFLGDRCSVEAVQGGGSGALPADTAILYPLILPDRIELLLRTNQGVQRRTAPVSSAVLKREAQTFAHALREGLDEFVAPARRLNDWLLKSFDDVLAAQRIHSLVVVPDGALRLVPVGALHDGKQYAIEKYAISMVTGMSLTNAAPPPAGKDIASLVVGVSVPGPVVEKLSALMASHILQPGSSDAAAKETTSRGLSQKRSLRSTRGATPAAAGSDAKKIEDLRAKLALPGVEVEVNALGQILRGNHLLDAAFTIDRFRQEAESGEYRILHIASHGVFGGSAETSFIMAYDDLLTMNRLQEVLKAEKFRKAPIELLSLSACETAEGNDRAPLGISGAAIKARAKGVLGTLWPVADDAAQTIMKTLYSGVVGNHLTKSEALRQAQIKLIKDPEMSHPFYWAPFVLIGNWL